MNTVSTYNSASSQAVEPSGYFFFGSVSMYGWFRGCNRNPEALLEALSTDVAELAKRSPGRKTISAGLVVIYLLRWVVVSQGQVDALRPLRIRQDRSVRFHGVDFFLEITQLRVKRGLIGVWHNVDGVRGWVVKRSVEDRRPRAC